MNREAAYLLLILVLGACLAPGVAIDHGSYNDWSSSSDEDDGGPAGSGRAVAETYNRLAAPETTTTEWVTRFCSSAGNEFFCEVPRDYMLDDFNWLNMTCDREALNTLVLARTATGSASSSTSAGASGMGSAARRSLHKQAQHMYGLIHARYILTAKGLLAMRDKFEAGHFGRCPRVYCNGQKVLPVSLSEESGRGETVKVYCPACKDVFHPQNSYHRTLDGAYWGTTFAHLFLLTFPDLRPLPALQQRWPPNTVGGTHRPGANRSVYQPRIFGFKVRTTWGNRPTHVQRS